MNDTKECLPAVWLPPTGPAKIPAEQLAACEFILMSDTVRVFQKAQLIPPTVLVDALVDARTRLDEACDDAVIERLRRYWRARSGQMPPGFAA